MIKGVYTVFYSSESEALHAFIRDILGFPATEESMKNYVLAVLSYLVLTFAITAPWHFVWFKDLYDSLGMYNRAEPIIPLGILTLLIQGGILAYLYPLFYRSVKTYAPGDQVRPHNRPLSLQCFDPRKRGQNRSITHEHLDYDSGGLPPDPVRRHRSRNRGDLWSSRRFSGT